MILDLPASLCGPAVRESLAAAYEKGRLPHALLLEGPPAEALALAKHLAQAAVCTDPEKRPCGHCAACVKALAGSHPDITIAGGSGGSRSFHKEDVAALRSDAFIRPNEAACRVFILSGAQDLSVQAQNALLKILEEPPDGVQFLLTCDNAAALLPTVRSRVQLFSLGNQPTDADNGLANRMAMALCAAKPSALLYASAPLLRDRPLQRATFDRLTAILRDALALRCGGPAVGPEDAAAASALSRALTRRQLYRALQETRRARAAVDANANGPLLVTTLCARLRAAAGK